MSRSPADDLPAGPPTEVLAEVDTAWERARELFESGAELNFEVDRLFGSTAAELRLADGRAARLSAREALAVACGDPLPLAARFERAPVV